MPEKRAAKKAAPRKTVKKTGKATAKKKKGAKVKKGQGFICELCGFSFYIDDCGRYEEREFWCCKAPMKAKKAK